MASLVAKALDLAVRAEKAANGASSTDDAAAKKKALKALRKKKNKNGAFYYPWYVECGVIGACMILYMLSLLRAWYLRRRGARARARTGPNPTNTPPALEPLGGARVSRIPAAMHALFTNLAYVRVIPVYFFEHATAAEWFFTAAYTGIVIGLVFWGATCEVLWAGRRLTCSPGCA